METTKILVYSSDKAFTDSENSYEFLTKCGDNDFKN